MIIKLQYSLIVLSSRGLGGALPNSRRFKELFCVLDELLGCFEDSPDRVLESGPHSLHINGRNQCARHCATLGSYRYFGLQVTIWNNSFISYGFVCIYIVLHVYLSLSYLKIVIGDVTLVETKASSIFFFNKFHE